MQDRNEVILPLHNKLRVVRLSHLHILRRFEFDPSLLRSACLRISEGAIYVLVKHCNLSHSGFTLSLLCSHHLRLQQYQQRAYAAPLVSSVCCW